MPKKTQNSGVSDEENLKPKVVEKVAAKKHEDYAAKVWNQIEKKAKSKSKREGLKGKIGDVESNSEPKAKVQEDHKDSDVDSFSPDNEGIVDPQKKKRRRKRKKKNVEVSSEITPSIEPKVDNEFEVQDVEEPVGEAPKLEAEQEVNEVVVPEVLAPEEDKTDEAPASPFVVQPEVMPPVPPVEPVNPFAAAPSAPVEQTYDAPNYAPPVSPFDNQGFQPQVQPQVQPAPGFEPPTNLPPQDYEHRYQSNQAAQNPDSDLEPKDEGDEFDEVPALDFNDDSKPDNAPLNPFDSTVNDKPLVDKALDDKPLDDFGYVEDKDQPEEIEEDAEAIGYADEQVDDSVSEENFSPSNDESELAEVVETRPLGEGALGGHVDGPLTELKDLAVGEEGSEFKEEFWDVLGQAGITKKRLLIFLVVLGVLVLGIIIWVFVFAGDESNVDVVKTEEPVDTNEVVGEEIVKDPYEIISAFIIGLDYNAHVSAGPQSPISSFGGSAGFESALALGQFGATKDNFIVKDSELLRKLQNIYDVDVYALVSQAVDRRAILEQHLLDMQNLINEGEIRLVKLDDELAALKLQYSALESEKLLYETAFFEQLQGQLGEASSGSYDKFLEYSKASLDVKAEFSAKASIREMLIKALNFLKPRLQDISLNKESIIKGVRYYEVPGSDINAINIE